MIPLASSPTALPVRHDSTSPCTDDVTELESCVPLARAVVDVRVGGDDVIAVVRSALLGNACAIARKRVSFADGYLDNDDECADAMSTKMTSHRSPMAKRRRRYSVWNDAQDTDQHKHLQSNALTTTSSSLPLQSINCNLDLANESRIGSSLSDEDERPPTPAATLPTDPRLWTRSDVHAWLRQTMSSASAPRQHQQPIDVDLERFSMNGKALCLMTSAMFAYRVPQGGHLLYKDFQARLCRAIAVNLHRNCTAGEQ